MKERNFELLVLMFASVGLMLLLFLAVMLEGGMKAAAPAQAVESNRMPPGAGRTDAIAGNRHRITMGSAGGRIELVDSWGLQVATAYMQAETVNGRVQVEFRSSEEGVFRVFGKPAGAAVIRAGVIAPGGAIEPVEIALVLCAAGEQCKRPETEHVLRIRFDG